MKAAREKLPSLGVKHAIRSDLSIFATPPTAEVHSLLPLVKPEQVGMWDQQSSQTAHLKGGGRPPRIWMYGRGGVVQQQVLDQWGTAA
jgi:hypothetical protein